MIGTLDRSLEEALVDLIDVEAGGTIQCIPNLLGAGENDAILPRIVVTCESQPSPEFMENADGVYGLYPVRTVVMCMVEATSSTSSYEMHLLTNAVDAVLIFNGDLADQLTAGSLAVYGVIPGPIAQERNGNKLVRHREMTIWARAVLPPQFIVDDITGEQVVDDITGEPITTG